jgi:anthranilate synthase component II
LYILIIDNFDSFTYNLAQYFQMLDCRVAIARNNAITLETIASRPPDALVISPGPNSPIDAGLSMAIIERFYQTIPILGVCLGHQCIAAAFGGTTICAPKIIHGKTSPIIHNKQGLFKAIPTPFNATRYHSLVVDKKTLPRCFQIDAQSDDLIMALSHHQYPIYGIQFHPEAILTEFGMDILANFLELSMVLKSSMG